ncbi:hypothetical protein IQ07DRAFT_590635 [Pyrenochaeta sp. DS3sAY3a]|nr:hypothetical protein IQ07DRAFT_590635 [Pyrenochaeta sp. DS3sAY3a]
MDTCFLNLEKNPLPPANPSSPLSTQPSPQQHLPQPPSAPPLAKANEKAIAHNIQIVL